ncbi:MAG: hypothetical protein ACK6D7_10805 [Acidobacteriota bacterium]
MLLLVSARLELDQFPFHVHEPRCAGFHFDVSQFEDHLQAVQHVRAGQAEVAVLQAPIDVTVGQHHRLDVRLRLILADQLHYRVADAVCFDE